MDFLTQNYLRNSSLSANMQLLDDSIQDIKAKNQVNLSYYLHSEESEISSSGLSNSKIQNQQQHFLGVTQKHYFSCPELYESFRTQTLVEQIKGDSFKILRYSRGRNEMYFIDCVQIELKQVVKLTVWRNGDYKLNYGDLVYFWYEDEQRLQKYSITL